jgi:hypothetical protein
VIIYNLPCCEKNTTNHQKRKETYREKSNCRIRVRVVMFNANINNISVISWWSVLLVEETRENH